MANDKYVRNLNGFTGLLAEGGHEATKFLGDAWEYWLGGKAGNAITKAVRKRAIAGITADLTAKGIMESEARNIAVRIANARTKTAAEKAFIHSLSGAATLGSAGAISGGVQQILTPAGGAKKAEIQERRAGGEKISPEQERQEIAQANAEAHSAGAVAKSTGGAALSGGASGALFGTGALAGDMASKAASKYFGDLTSEAVGYAAKLNTNAAAATAMGQMEGAISGQQPEGSIAQQFARNVVNFAMLDGLNYAPKMLNRHPVRNYRQWKEYERSTGISEEDEARMRDAGYGDLIDTVDGLVSDRLRNRAAQSTAPNGTKDRAVAKREPGNSEKEQQETKINEGMLKLLADPRLPEELKRKYYMVVTGDTSRQLSPIVASEVSTDDDSKTRLVTYNKNGGVVSDREYRNEKAAKEAQEKIGHEQDENLTQALQQNVYAKDADSVMKEAYDAAAQVYNNGGSLNTGQRTLIYLYQHKPQLDKALQAMTSGEPLSDEDRKLVSLLNTVQGTLYKMNGTIPRIANDIEEDYGLGTDGLKAAREGHTEKEAKKISAETGEEIVHVGGDVWRTRNEDAAVKEYQRRLFDYSTNVEEGKDVEMPEPKGLPGEAEGEAAQSTAPNGTEPPTDGDQPPTDQLQQGEGQPSKVQQIRAQGRERGSSVMDDETMLDQLQYESDYANQRLDNAFPDGELSDFRDGLVKAVDDGDDDAIQTLLDKYDSRLSQEQKDAAMNYVESAGAMEGIDDTIVAKTQQYQTQRKEELDRISDHNGNITMLTLADGSKLYYISGDLTNEYGGVIATDEWGKRQQIPVSSITGVGEVQSSQAILENDTNYYAAAVEKHFMDMANGRKMLSGQRTTINIGGEDVNAVCDGTLDDGTVVLALDDGSKIQMSPDELSQTRAAARKASVERNLAEADNLREMQAREERFKNGIDDYGTSSPDIGGKGTKPEVAAEYLHEQDKKNGTDSKATLKDMDQRLKTTHFNERQSKREIDHMQDLLSVADEGSENYDLYKQRIEQYTQQLAEDQRRQRKIAEVRNAYMTPKEKQQMKMERMGAIDKARKAAEEERRNVLRRTGQSEEEQVKVEGIDSKSLLGKYKTQAEADAALQQQRDTIMKDYRDGAGTAIADIQNQLREYGDGLRELDDDELSDLSSRLVEAQQQEKRAIEQAKQIKAAQQRLPLTYKDRNKEEVDKLSPREKRAHILQGARDPQDLLRRAREAYADSDMVGRLDDLEPETLEEYVSQNIGYGQFNWEGSGTGIARKRGLKEELGLKRGIGRNYDSNAINAYLAPKGQGESVDEVAHGLWEGRPSNMEQYDTQDMRNMVLELLGGDESARSIKYKTIQNRIDELESYEQAQEEQEEWYRLQAEEEERKRQIDEDTYKDYLNTMHAELAPLFDTVKDFLNGLYADEIAMAEDEAHEQEEAWNEYLAEKEKQEQAAAEQRRTKTINDGTEETDGTGAVGRGRTLDKQSEPGGVQTRGSEGQAPLRGEEPDKSHAPLEDYARQSDDRGTTAAATGNSSADRGILVPEEAQDHKPAVKLTRTGDFYEVHGDGADIAGRVLGITVTKRHGIGTKMAGFPVHALDTYLAKLIKAGYPVDIIENGKVVEHVIPQESIGTTSTPEQVESERQSVNTEPTEKQKEAGNYKKGHIKVDGYDITIENPKGSTRSGKDASGKAWSVPMRYDYGYIKGTEGVDGDHIDVYLSDDPTKGNVYVVDQVNQNDGSFDEHKVMYGFPSMEAAVEAYKGQYEDGWKVGTVTEVSREDFKKWVESSKRKTKPFSEYSLVKKITDGSKTQKNVDEVLDEVERRKRSGIPEAESKRKQFDPSVRKDLERFVGEAKGKGITIDWEHSEPENAYIPTKIAGKASFVGVTEQDSDTPMTFPSDRPIAIYDIAEGGDIPDATKIDKFEAYVKEYNSSKSLTEGSDDYASMDDQYPYVSFKSVDAAAKFNDWLNAEGRHSDGSNVDMADSLLDEVAARNDISEHATMKAEELKGREVEDLRTLEKKERAQADTDEQLAKIAKGEKRDKLLNDVKAHRANAELAKRVREEKEKEAEDIWGFHRASSRVGRLTKREIALRDALNDAVRETGIEVIEDVEEGQHVLDMANDALLNKNKKRALETASPSLNGTDHQTVVSSTLGAKVLKDLDNLVNEYEFNKGNKPNTFIGDLSRALGAQKHGSNSEYANFETKNGRVVTIRLANHNAKVSTFDNHNETDGISIVITANSNAKLTNDGNTHVTEFYYNALKLRRAEGKPLAAIVRSIKQALYSGEFNDTTGLAERQEVNAADIVREQRVYHGSGADFDAFDNSHMGEGEGVQAHGWGTYVTKSESVGEKYAVKSDKATGLKRSELESNISRAEEQLSYLRGEVKAEKEKEIKEWKDELANLDGSKWLYTVEIPDDTGNNYIEEKQSLQDLKRGDISERIDKAMDEYFGVKDSFYSWRLPGWAMREEFIRLAKGRHPEMSRGEADRKFSEVLSSAGVVGVHYDGRKDGDCYVIFNDKDLKITGKVKFFRTPNGEAYGYTVGGKIYEDPRIASSDTPIHEYAHLWAAMLRKVNPKEWENVIKLMKDTWAWDYVKKLYPDLKAEDEIADEALAMFSGKRGAEQARKAMGEFMEESMDGKDDLKTAAKKGLMRLKEALSKFWKNVCDLLHVHFTSAEEVADRVMYDMLRGFKSDNIDRGYREDRDYSKEEDSQKDAVVRYRLADPDESAVLDDQPTVKVYRAMQLIDGKLYPPMMAAVKGKLVEPRELGQWEIADERPDIIENVKKNKAGEEIGYVTLDKGSKDSTGKKGTPIKGVAYNPYWHTSRSPLNDQFKSAWIRPNIVTVEVEVPVSELRSGYRAKYAKDPVGETDWHSGSVTKQLTAQGHAPRKVILRRYDKPVKVLSAAETAERIIDYIGDYDVTIPENVVTPQVRVELEKRGIKIGAPEKGVKKTEQIREAIERGLSVDAAAMQQPTERSAETDFHNVVDAMYTDPDFDRSSHLRDRYDIGQTPDWMKKVGISGDNFSLSFKNIKTHQGKDADHDLTREEWHEIPGAIQHPFLVTKYKGASDRFRLYVNMLHNGHYVAVGIDVKRVNQGKDKPILEVNSIKTVFAKGAERIADDEIPVAVDKNITPEQQALLRGHNFHEYPTIQELSIAKLSNNSESDVNKGENVLGSSGERYRKGNATHEYNESELEDMQDAAEELGEVLGDVPVNVEHNGKDGIKGSFNSEDNSVHVNMDEADGVDDVIGTVYHEVLGHFGLKALFGSNEAVDKFGQFIYDSASKELRRRIVERAEEEGYEWTDPKRFAKAAQEVFSDIAADGPATADEFSLWRKVKHYIIQALKRLGIRVRGLLNDHDLRYYVLKTGEALKRWNAMSEEARAAAAEPGRIMYRSGKPRKRKDETMSQYIQRLQNWEQWRQAEERAREANDPAPEKDDYDKKAQEEYNAAVDAWRKENGIAPGDKEPGAFPKRRDGESPQDYAIRVADYEYELDKWKGIPDVFMFMKKALDDYRRDYEAWKMRYDIHEMESVDEKLYSGDTGSDEAIDEDEHYDKMEVDTAVEKDIDREIGEAVGVDTSAEGAQYHAKLAVIERRKNLESASAEDAIFIHDLCKQIDETAKEMGMDPKDLRWKLINIIERPIAQEAAEQEVTRWVDLLNKMRPFQDAHTFITADGVEAAKAELRELQRMYYVYGENPNTDEGRRAVHDAAVALADKLNDYYSNASGCETGRLGLRNGPFGNAKRYVWECCKVSSEF